MTKRTCFKTLAFFFLVVIAILVPFGIIISYKIASRLGISSKISSKLGIISRFSSYFSEITSNRRSISASIVFKHCQKSGHFLLLPKLLQLFTPLPPTQIRQLFIQLTACILLTTLAPNMQLKLAPKIKGHVFNIGGINVSN